MDKPEYGIPVMSSKHLAVIKAAEAYVDQLGSFNRLTHPEVVWRRKELADAVAILHGNEEDENAQADFYEETREP